MTIIIPIMFFIVISSLKKTIAQTTDQSGYPAGICGSPFEACHGEEIAAAESRSEYDREIRQTRFDGGSGSAES